MGTTFSILSAKGLQNCEPPEIHLTHRSRAKEKLIEDAESEARVKLNKLCLRIRELESQKKVLLLCMEQIKKRLRLKITKINMEHDELTHVQSSLQLDDSNVTEELSETVQCITETTLTEDQARQTQLQETYAVTYAVTDTIQCETMLTEDRAGQTQSQETYAVTDTLQCETMLTEDRAGQTQSQETYAVTDTIQCETMLTEDRARQTQSQETYAVTDTIQCVTETMLTEDRAGQTQSQETYAVTDTIQCVTETMLTKDRAGQTQSQETYAVTDTPDTATATMEPYMTEQEESLLNQLLHKKLNYKQNCVDGIDVNTGIPVTRSQPHVYMTALEKSLLNKLGTMCLCDLWHRKGLKLKDFYIGHSKSTTEPTVTMDTDDTLHKKGVTQADKSTKQLPEPCRLDTYQLTNDSTLCKLTDNCTCPCNSSDSCSPQPRNTQGVTYCISDMLASCSQPVTDAIKVVNKSPTSHHLSRRREQRRVQRAKKSTKQEIKSKSNLSRLSGNLAQDEVQKSPYACSYDSSFWKKLQFQPVIADNAEKKETVQNQPDFIASRRNVSASIGDNKTTRKEPEIQIQSNNSTTPMPSVAVTDNNSKTHTQPNSIAKQQSKSGLNTDEALKSEIDAIQSCPQVKLSVYRLEHLTNTLESQILYLEALSSFNMYLKAPLIMREVCAKLDPYFLWDWCVYANKTRARDNNRIHRDMLNFLKKKVYCSTLYLRPYYEESTKEVFSS